MATISPLTAEVVRRSGAIPHAEYLLEVAHVRKAFPGVLALDDVQFRLKRGGNRLGFPEPVRLALESQVGVADAVRGQIGSDALGLLRCHDGVIKAVEQQDRAGGLRDVTDRGALGVDGVETWQRADQPVQVP